MDDATEPVSTAARTAVQEPPLPAGAPAAPAPRPDPRVATAPLPAEADAPWLHVVSGSDLVRIARGVFELSARFLAGGHRVLVVDAAPGLGLHECFGRGSERGVTDALAGLAPLLELIQGTGRLGLYLLARGPDRGEAGWPHPGRILEPARPHFGRAIVALIPGAQSPPDEALGAPRTGAWWVGKGDPPQAAWEPWTRAGIRFRALGLDTMPQATLEALEARLWALAARTRAAGAPTPTAAGAAGPPAPGPPTLDCDLRVRERLRFLLWMRRVAAEARPRAAGG